MLIVAAVFGKQTGKTSWKQKVSRDFIFTKFHKTPWRIPGLEFGNPGYQVITLIYP